MEIVPLPRQSIAIPVQEQTQVGDARRAAARLTSALGMNENDRAAAALIVTELGTNLAKYATDGQIVFRLMDDGLEPALEILSLDSGPGFRDIDKRIADGYSSGGTAGNGLGAVRRMSQFFDIYSSPDVGTAILARIGRSEALAEVDRQPLSVGVVCVPKPGEDKSGDGWAVHQSDGRALLAVVDGLGHGVIAGEAADAALRVFDASVHMPAVDILLSAHDSLRTTRGAVMAIAEVDLSNDRISYAGVGNISACVTNMVEAHHMISLNGTLGLTAKPRAYEYSWPANSLLIMCSDGLTTKWRLDTFPAILARHPSIIAGMLYQHHSRRNDDATVLVLKRCGN